MRIFPLVILTGALCTPLWADPVFLPGVTLEDGWYDCNKRTKWTEWPQVKPNPLTPAQTKIPSEYYNVEPKNDQAMCWAAAAANVLTWWQRSRTDVSSTTPDGYAASYTNMPQVSQLAVYQSIGSNWTEAGGTVKQAYNYWFNGGMLNTGLYPSPSTLKDGAHQGGYWQELNLTVPENPSGTQASNPLFTSYSFYTENTLDDVHRELMNSINNGYGTTLSLGVDTSMNLPIGHVVTMWGYEQQADGSLILYLTDSDDYQVALIKKKVVLGTKTDTYTNKTSNYFFLVDPDSTQDFVLEETFDPETTYVADLLREVTSLTAPLGTAFAAVPEPASATLALASLFGLALRRRR